MGIIAAAMIAAHSEGIGMGINSIDDLPSWVAFACFTVISLGTMSGGWKIVKTMGTRITKVTPLEGVIAETAGAFTPIRPNSENSCKHYSYHYRSHHWRGATKRLSAVRWGVTKKPDNCLDIDHSGQWIISCWNLSIGFPLLKFRTIKRTKFKTKGTLSIQ